MPAWRSPGMQVRDSFPRQGSLGNEGGLSLSHGEAVGLLIARPVRSAIAKGLLASSSSETLGSLTQSVAQVLQKVGLEPMSNEAVERELALLQAAGLVEVRVNSPVQYCLTVLGREVALDALSL